MGRGWGGGGGGWQRQDRPAGRHQAWQPGQGQGVAGSSMRPAGRLALLCQQGPTLCVWAGEVETDRQTDRQEERLGQKRGAQPVLGSPQPPRPQQRGCSSRNMGHSPNPRPCGPPGGPSPSTPSRCVSRACRQQEGVLASSWGSSPRPAGSVPKGTSHRPKFQHPARLLPSEGPAAPPGPGRSRDIGQRRGRRRGGTF